RQAAVSASILNSLGDRSASESYGTSAPRSRGDHYPRKIRRRPEAPRMRVVWSHIPSRPHRRGGNSCCCHPFLRQPVGHPAPPTDYFHGRVLSSHGSTRLFLFIRHPDYDVTIACLNNSSFPRCHRHQLVI